MRSFTLAKLLLISILLSACGSDVPPAAQSAPSMASLQSSSKGAMAAAAAPIVLSGPRSNYTITASGAGYSVVDKTGKDPARTIAASDRLRFTDTSLAFEIEGVAGKGYRLYQAAFARTPDAAGLGYWIGLMDKGASLSTVAAEFVGSAEFKVVYGATPTNKEVVDKFYRNVLGREGEPAGVAFWLGLLDNKTITVTQLLAEFSESPENKASVLKVIKDGVPFEEFGIGYAPADTPAGQSAGTGTLNANVVVLSASDSARIVSKSSTKVTFSGTYPVTPGKVILASDTVFKVVSSAQEGGNTVVTVTAPALEDLFDTLQIKGTYTASGAQVETASSSLQSAVRARQADVTVGDSFSFSGTLVDGNTTMTNTLSGGLQATVAYDFQASNGGLKSASVDLNASTKLVSQLHLAERSSVAFEKMVGAVRIPIPVTVADKVLGALGVRIVSLYVPFYVGASLSSEFDIKLARAASASGKVSMSYNVVSGATMSSAMSSTVEDTSFTSTTPGGAPALATFKETASVYVKARPALAFLETVALAGVDLKLSGDGSALLQAPVPLSPFYCLVTTPSASLSAFGFVKGGGFTEATTPAISKVLWTGVEARYGSCKAATLLSATVPEGTVGVPLTVNATVALDPKMLAVPGVAPTGTVSVSGAGASCNASLTAQGSTMASGSCVLTPATSGAPASFKFDYAGDAKFAPSTKTVQATVKAPQFAGTYVGTFSGDDKGTFIVVVTTGGSITGTGTSAEGTFGVSGSVGVDGTFFFSTGGSTSTGSVFKGGISVSGTSATISGTWANAEFQEKGTFGGTRQ